MPQFPFHLAFPVRDLASTRDFYGELLQCREGRSAERWVDFDFFGHQISAHVVDADSDTEGVPTNAVDGENVPVRHFGAVLSVDVWQQLASRLRDQGTKFIIEPTLRFEGQPGAQWTMFFLDPSGNALEFKAFEHSEGMWQG